MSSQQIFERSRPWRYRSGFQAAGLLLSLVVFAGASASAAPPRKQPQQSTPAAQSDFVGAETCATCHDEVSKKFASNPHSRLAMEHAGHGVTCESCHGPGRAHVEGGGDVAKIFNPAKVPAAAVNKMCLTCHQNQHADFDHSAHGEANVSCIGCHSIHTSRSETNLLRAAQPLLCYQCHSEIKPQFAMPFHHRVEEGLMQCSDCHDPHGTIARGNLKSAAQQDLICISCHTETAGPFVYEHNVVRAEGCMACHTPHGSPNPRLLNRGNVNSICLQCHTPSANFTTSGIPTFHNQVAQYQACTVCHASIHGSNTSSIFFNSTE